MIFPFFQNIVMAILRANPLRIENKGVTGLCTRKVSSNPNLWCRVHTVAYCSSNLQQGNFLTMCERQTTTLNNE